MRPEKVLVGRLSPRYRSPAEMGAFSSGPLFASLIIGAIGLGMFLYGKRQKRLPQMLSGLVLMVFPYFVSGILPMVAIAATLIGLTWLATRAGW
jgi:hypothetical protein